MKCRGSSQVSGKVMEGHCICWLYCTGCSFLSALAYGATSCAMVFLNKGVLMTYKHSMTVLTLQVVHLEAPFPFLCTLPWLARPAESVAG